MFENSYFKKCMIILLFYCCFVYDHTVSAHEGHSHEAVITIGKKTVVHLQTILSTYQEVYTHLVKKDLHGISLFPIYSHFLHGEDRLRSRSSFKIEGGETGVYT